MPGLAADGRRLLEPADDTAAADPLAEASPVLAGLMLRGEHSHPGGRLLAYRLEEPLELIGALLLNVALVIKYGEGPRARPWSRSTTARLTPHGAADRRALRL